ncbi:ATP-binding protein [Cryptosporangium arvum]|uniref:ATP-binding protein n=1 Tax=Cryptosporangium arvum TaxID=80871 RepID=UPI0004B5CD06|nr:ATP-binding protein [Cryptosporangium arvum]
MTAGCRRVRRIVYGLRSIELELTITDDGDPPPEWHPGLGIRSLRDRAEELGGTAEVGPVPGGWAVTARLPRGRREPVRSGT